MSSHGGSQFGVQGLRQMLSAAARAKPALTTATYDNYNYNILQLPLQLHYVRLQNTSCSTLPSTPLHYIKYSYSYNHNCDTLHYTRLYYTTLLNISRHSLHHHNYNCNCTTLVTLHQNYNSTALQLQWQLEYTTLHPVVVSEVTTATIATSPKTQLQPPFGPSVDSLCHP